MHIFCKVCNNMYMKISQIDWSTMECSIFISFWSVRSEIKESLESGIIQMSIKKPIVAAGSTTVYTFYLIILWQVHSV